MRPTVILSLAFVLIGTACPANKPSAPPSENEESESPRSPTGPKPKSDSLRQRLDVINLWPDVDTSDLLPVLTSKTTFRTAGSSKVSIQGTTEIMKALKALQSQERPWRIAASRGYQTASRIAVEFELLKCSDLPNKACEESRSGLLFAQVDGTVVEDVTLYLNETWRPNQRRNEGKRPVRWVGGRRNPTLEKAFHNIWSGDLESLLSQSFRYKDNATGLELQGIEQFMAHRNRYAKFFPEGQCQPQEIHSTGDIVIALSTCEGVFKRNVRGNGRKISVNIADVARFEGSLLVELHSFSNHEEVNKQLGVASPSSPD